MTYAIIASLPEELAILRKNLQNVHTETHAGLELLLGSIGSAQVVATVCGVGKVNAARTAQVLLDHYTADALIHTGVAGSLVSEVGHMHLVVSTALRYHDMDSDWLNATPCGGTFPADAHLCEALYQSASALGTAHRGIMATGDVFVNDPALKAGIRERTGAICVDMETAATAHVSLLNEVPYCAVKCISDLAEGGEENSFRDFLDRAADLAAGTVLAMLRG